MFPINQFNITKVSETDTEGVFQIGPLPKGYGSTLGNTYRRLLMSSIPGAAVTAVKIKGVQHEYTALAGLQDDILAIVLTLKDLVVLSHTEDPVTLSLKVKGDKKGPKQVLASDISRDSMVEIVNPDHVITTLADEKAEIDAEITVSKGLGYAMPDESVRREIGMIPIDAIYTPVRLVSVDVTNTRVGQQTDLDQLTLKVVTNGTVAPSAALYQAAEILVELSKHLQQSAKDLMSAKAAKQVSESSLPIDKTEAVAAPVKGGVSLHDLQLSTRLLNALTNNGYDNLNQLDGLTEEEVKGLKGMGDKSFVELMDILKENNIKLI